MPYFMGSNPVQRQKEAPTLARADEVLDAHVANALKTLDANNVLHYISQADPRGINPRVSFSRPQDLS